MAGTGNRSSLVLPLLAVCAALALAVYLQSSAELALPDDPSGAAAALEPALELSDEPAFRMAPIERFSETVTRPLFMATRRPPEPGAPAAAVPERATSALPPFEVSGIVISPRERLALLARGRSREVIRVSEGELIEGWVVRSILPDRVILEQNGTQQELKLEDKAPRVPDRRKRKRTLDRQSQSERRATSPAQRPAEGEPLAGSLQGLFGTDRSELNPE
ncbi:MAG: hypothetical protein O7A68_01525 [Alphaproteobacteria bacterium]|nr:hypothetical protein [Alphaproteobacteria bacterium]